jgi:hypothetical protein
MGTILTYIGIYWYIFDRGFFTDINLYAK